MLNGIFVFLVLASVLLAAFTGRMDALTEALLGSAGKAVTLALGLVGVMAFFLGLMRVAQDGGLLHLLARVVGPFLRRLFPSVPADHPAMSAMVLNFTANFLGLANAATPFGIKAMEELDRINTDKGTATDAMVTFLAINTAGPALLPAGVIALRASLGSEHATGILLTTWIASGTATVAGLAAALLLARLPRYRASAPEALPEPPAVDTAAPEAPEGAAAPTRRPWRWGSAVAGAFGVALLGAFALHTLRAGGSAGWSGLARDVVSHWTLPALVALVVLFGWGRGVRVYDSLVEGAKEGFGVALRIIPYLVAILVAVGMFRASGGIDLMTRALGPLTAWIGMPAEALPMAVLRPLSGSGAYGVMAEIMSAHGPDTAIGYLVSTLQGSTETTFYVLAVYYGAVAVRRTRHTLPACLTADVAGMLAAVWIVRVVYGG